MSDRTGLHYFDYQVPSDLKGDFCDARKNFIGALPQGKDSIHSPPSGLIDMDSYLRISSYKKLDSQIPVPHVPQDGNGGLSCFRTPAGPNVPRNNVNERTLRAETDSKTFPFLNPVRPIQDFVFIPSNTKKLSSSQIEAMYRK